MVSLTLAFCFAATGLTATGCAGSATPTTMPDLSSLPDDPVERNERIESIEVRPGPETRQPLPPKLNQVETAAATTAAILGMIFSKSATVLLGGAQPIDENLAVGAEPPLAGAEPAPASRRPAESKTEEGQPDLDGGGGGATEKAGEVDASQLVPWVRLPSPGRSPR